MLGAGDLSAAAAVLRSNRPRTTDKLVVSRHWGRPSAERSRGGWGSARVNPLFPDLRPRPWAQRPDSGGRAERTRCGEGAPGPALLIRGAARAGFGRGTSAAGPRVREVSRVAEKPGGGIAARRPAGIWRAIPGKRGPRKQGKEESLSLLKNIRALPQAGAAARAPLAASARLAPLPPSGRGRGAPGLRALGRAGLRRTPSWSSPPPPGGLGLRGPRAGGAGPGS